MDPAIITAIFTKWLIPELGRYLARRAKAGLPPPTKEELLAELQTLADTHIATGEAFLRSKGVIS